MLDYLSHTIHSFPQISLKGLEEVQCTHRQLALLQHYLLNWLEMAPSDTECMVRFNRRDEIIFIKVKLASNQGPFRSKCEGDQWEKILEEIDLDLKEQLSEWKQNRVLISSPLVH